MTAKPKILAPAPMNGKARKDVAAADFRLRPRRQVVQLRAMLGFLNGLWLSYLPERWRRRWFRKLEASPVAGATTTGVAQALLCLAVLGYGLPGYVRSLYTAEMTTATLAVAEKAGETGVMGMGPLLLVGYVFQPFSLLLIFFMVEGVVRATAALVSDEALPTTPLFLLSLLHRRGEEWKRERDLGERVIDLVTPESGRELLIASCRPKEWNRLTTIRYQDELYELKKENTGGPPRPFLYLLRPIPRDKVVRGVYDYSPDEVLPEKERAPAAGAAQ